MDLLASLLGVSWFLRALEVFDELSSSTMSPLLKAYKSVMECEHCERRGHVKAFCWDIHGKPKEHSSKIGRDLDNGKDCKQVNIQGLFDMALAKGLIPVLMSRDEFELWRQVKNAATGTKQMVQTSKDLKAKLMSATSQESGEVSGSLSVGSENDLSAPWIIDSGATNHMTGSSRRFLSYAPRSGKDRVKIADGSSAPIMGCGIVSCTSSLSLNPVLHVPNFPLSLLSVSSITKSLNCRAVFEPTFCVFQELKSGRVLGTGTERDGLYYLDNKVAPLALSTVSTSNTDELLLLHHRLGHPSFQSLGRMFPSLFTSCCKEKLICEVCELAKHTRINYPSSGERCNVPLEVVHSDVWGPSKVTSLLGERWYVTFIDGFSRCTWLYLLKHKSEVLSAFKDFYTLVCNQYNANVKVFRSDNGTEYLNGDFDSFLASRGIIHQTPSQQLGHTSKVRLSLERNAHQQPKAGPPKRCHQKKIMM